MRERGEGEEGAEEVEEVVVEEDVKVLVVVVATLSRTAVKMLFVTLFTACMRFGWVEEEETEEI